MDTPYTLSFEEFWPWMANHHNCIVRAGTSECMLYDDEDLHWHFAGGDEGQWFVQLVRGKRLMGELMVDPERVTYVQEVPGEHEDEHLFELIWEGKNERLPSYFFVMAHSYEEEPAMTSSRVH